MQPRSERQRNGQQNNNNYERGEKLAVGLGWFSIGLGVTALAAPRQLGKLIGVKDRLGTLRAIGAREIATGIGILSQPSNPAWLWARVAGDAMDLSLLGNAASNSRRSKGRVTAGAIAVAGVTALDFVGGQILSRSQGNGMTARRAVRVHHTMRINRSAEDLYRFWHDFENLGRFMKHLESVHVMGDKHSHWVAKAPAGNTVAWDAEVVTDRPNEMIAWRSLPGASIDNSGSVRFEPARNGRGTDVRVEMTYNAPGGKFGQAIAKMLGEEPEFQVREDLRRFKQLMEAGEIPTTEGQPSGRMSAGVLEQAKPTGTKLLAMLGRT